MTNPKAKLAPEQESRAQLLFAEQDLNPQGVPQRTLDQCRHTVLEVDQERAFDLAAGEDPEFLAKMVRQVDAGAMSFDELKARYTAKRRVPTQEEQH